jgi:hypothetical protein
MKLILDVKTLREASSHIAQAINMVTETKDVMEEEWQEKSEKWQEGEAGQEAQTKIDTLAELIDVLDNAASELDDLTK